MLRDLDGVSQDVRQEAASTPPCQYMRVRYDYDEKLQYTIYNEEGVTIGDLIDVRKDTDGRLQNQYRRVYGFPSYDFPSAHALSVFVREDLRDKPRRKKGVETASGVLRGLWTSAVNLVSGILPKRA